jgi:putative ABC transport system permease protein
MGNAVLPAEKEMFSSWGSNFVFTYLRLRSPSDAAAMQAAMPGFVDRRVTGVRLPASRWIQFDLVPLRDIHFKNANTRDGLKPGADPMFVAALGIMGLATLLIAIVNYVSLATARSGMRAREVAVRKVMGATRRSLIVQFITEAVITALAAGLIGAALAELALPGVKVVLGEPIRMTYFGSDGIVLPLVVGCAAVGVASGVYPALVLSGFRPASVLAAARTPGGGRVGGRVREGLAVFQFAVAITLMICTAVFFAQVIYLRNADIGFRRDGLLVVRDVGTPDAAPHMAAMMESFRHIRGVSSVAASTRRPGTDMNILFKFTRADDPAVNPDLLVEFISPGYLQTYGAKLLAGRGLGTEFRLDDFAGRKALPADQKNQVNILINQRAARAFGFVNPQAAIGRQLKFGQTDDGRPEIATVVGVMENIRFQSLRDAPDSQAYIEDSSLATDPDSFPRAWSIAIRLSEPDRAAVTAQAEQIWRSMVPGQPFRAESVEAAMKPFYDPDARRGQLFAAGAVLSGIIACLGLYGLAAFNTTRRYKEIGIRKTLGASTGDVMRLLVGEFLRPVLIANLIAWPVAWFAMRAWLAGFDQRIALNPAYFIVPALIAVVVAAATVLQQTLRVSRAEPARALRYE